MFKFLVVLLISLMTVAASAESKFSNESELGIVQVGGNSSSESYNAKTVNKLENGKDTYKAGGHYTVTFAETTDTATSQKKENETARNWDVFLGYERAFSDKLGMYAQIQVEGNEFAGFKQRRNYGLGAKYTMIKTEDRNFFGEIGLRQVEEEFLNGVNPNSADYMAGRLYLEHSMKHSKTLSSKFWVEYIPNFDDSEDYRIIFEPSIAVVLSDIFSLKMAYKGMYDNQPASGATEYLDYVYTTSLLAKF